jgi:hypothetical protein
MMFGLFLAKSMIFLLCFLSVLNFIQIVCTHYVILYFREAQSVNNNLSLICGSYSDSSQAYLKNTSGGIGLNFE